MAALSQGALDLDCAVHHAHDILRDGHAQPGPLYAVGLGLLRPGEGLKNMGDEILGHPKSIVGDDKLVLSPALGKGRHLLDPKADASAVGRIFHRIGQQVGEHLLQAVLIRYHDLVPHMVGVDLQLLMLFRRQRPEHVHDVLNQLRQGDGLGNEIDFPTLDFGHIQHLVDEVQKMPAGDVDFIQAVLYFFRGLQICLRDDRHANDGVHGRADIVGHGGEKVCFGVVGDLSRLAGVFQCLPLPGLLRALRRHVDAHAVIGGNPIPTILCADIAVCHHQNLDRPAPGDDAGLHGRGLPG